MQHFKQMVEDSSLENEIREEAVEKTVGEEEEEEEEEEEDVA